MGISLIVGAAVEDDEISMIEETCSADESVVRLLDLDGICLEMGASLNVGTTGDSSGVMTSGGATGSTESANWNAQGENCHQAGWSQEDPATPSLVQTPSTQLRQHRQSIRSDLQSLKARALIRL